VSPTPRAAIENRLLQSLPATDRRRLLADCEEVELKFAEELYTPGNRLGHVYFPTGGFISLIMPIDNASSLEVGLVGSDGMFGIPLALGVDVSPVRAVVQGAGPALRLDAAHFTRELKRRGAVESAMHRYAFVQLTQLAQAAACTRFHVVESRLARWLLMTQDCAHSDSFHITQEFMALMLGVRRVGVTKAASALQERELIQYRRGNITVLDRRGLQAAACGCYQADRDSYKRILG
jgi:CRP-like cAMP-binding protein